MKILLIHNYYQQRGGEDTYFDMLIRLLKENKQEIKTITTSNENINETLIGKMNAFIETISPKQFLKNAENAIQGWKPAIVHINNIFPLITAEIYSLCNQYQIPIIQSIHTYRYLCPKGTLTRDGRKCELCVRKLLKYPAVQYGCYHNSRIASLAFTTSFLYHNTLKKLSLVDKFIFPSYLARNYHTRRLPMSIEKTVVLPHFVYKPKKSQNEKKQDFFLYVGRLSEEKRIIQLLEIFAALPNFRLIVIGDGPQRNEVDSFQLYSHITIKHAVSRQLRDLYMQNALATIIPSMPYFEFGPYVLFESYACATPVVAPDGGVFQQRVKDGKTGYLFKPYDFQDLRRIIIKMGQNKTLRSQMGRLAYREYQKYYTPGNYYHNLMGIYKDLIS